jgi:hypothetical protein
MPRIVAWTLAGSLSLLSAAPLRADDNAPPVDVGARVRITAAAPTGQLQKTIGRLVAIEADRLTLAVEGRPAPLVVPVDSLVRLERSVRKSKRWKGALLGFGITMAAIVLASTDTTCDDSGAPGCSYVGEGLLYGFVLGLPAAGLGALIAPGEKWQDAEPVAVEVSATPHGAAVRFSVRF